MKTSIAQTLKLMAASALAAFALTACMTQSNEDYTPDGGNVIISEESSNMGQVLNSTVTAKVSAALHSDSGEKIVKMLNDTVCIDSNGQSHPCFVREAKFTSSDTLFVRNRYDTLWLLDSNNAYMTVFRPFQATTIIHHRHVVKVNAAKDIDIQFNTTLTRGTDSTGPVLIWNGTITGTINGETINATITNVTRPITLGVACGLPRDGKIHIERGGNEVDISFEGAGKADVVVKGRKGRVHHGKIDGGRETQKD